MTNTSGFQQKLRELRGSRIDSRRKGTADRRDSAQVKFEYLLEQEVFAPLSSDEKRWLMESTAMVTCERGQVFHAPDELGEVVFILKRGKVDLYRLHPDGRKIVVATLGQGSIFGEMSLIGQRMYGCFAEAAEDCVICVLSRTDLQALVRRNPDVGLLILAEMGNRLHEREAEIEAISFQTIPTRLAGLLLREAEDGVVAGLSHQDLADRLGTYRETVSQALGRFRERGWVVVEQKRIQIVDAEALNDIANT
jgi:CRP-like cAMP-binding protein